MATSTPPHDTTEHQLLLELAGASVALSPDDFADYATDRLKPLLVARDPEYLNTLLLLSATMTGAVIEQWAENTDRTAQDVFQAMRGRMSHDSDT